MLTAAVMVAAAGFAHAQEQTNLAKQMSNPVADLISVPIQFNYDRGIGPAGDGYRITSNLQPVIPFKLDADWTLITRTIVPFIHQDEIFPGADSQFGLGDIAQSFFFSPNPVPIWAGSTFIWAAGPVMLVSEGAPMDVLWFQSFKSRSLRQTRGA